jgi:transcription factor 1
MAASQVHLNTLRKRLRRFPITTQLKQAFLKRRGRSGPRAELVNEELLGKSSDLVLKVYNADALLDLIDGIVQRVSPYLRQNPPSDILDLWPSCGTLSSKVNQLIQPRRHVLVEPNEAYLPILEPLIRSKPCYKLLNQPLYAKVDWLNFLQTHFPEQSPVTQQKPGVLPKNDALLILANLPASLSPKDHYTPGRWWLKFLEDCLLQTGLNSYGSVRVLAMSPFKDLTVMLPRTTADCRRTGLFAETLGLHNFEIASSVEPESWHASRGWDSIYSNRKRVAERAAAQNIVTPPNRELPPLQKVPEVEYPGRKGSPYTARMYMPQHDDIFQTIATGDATGLESPADTKDPLPKEAMKKRSLAISKLATENTAAYTRQKLTSMRLHLDEQTRKLARAAADPNETPENLRILDDQIGSLESTFAAEVSNTHHKVARFYETNIDDSRLACISNNFDDSQLTWDRRPFEPLVIHPDEIWSCGKASGLIYFEAHERPPALQKIFQLPNSAHVDALERFQAILGVINVRNAITVPEIGKLLFPGLSTNELVQAIPKLATFASKRIKPGSGPIPLSDPTLDPVTSYQENLNYDLSEVRLRVISLATIADMVVEYEKDVNKLNPYALSRNLGGSLTWAQLGGEIPTLTRSC